MMNVANELAGATEPEIREEIRQIGLTDREDLETEISKVSAEIEGHKEEIRIKEEWLAECRELLASC